MVLAKNIAHDMKSGADGAHFFGALLLTFSFDKHSHCTSLPVNQISVIADFSVIFPFQHFKNTVILCKYNILRTYDLFFRKSGCFV